MVVYPWFGPRSGRAHSLSSFICSKFQPTEPSVPYTSKPSAALWSHDDPRRLQGSHRSGTGRVAAANRTRAAA